MKNNNIRLGISVYPEIVGKEKTIEYIKLAKANGFKRIFANLLEVEDNEEGKEKIEMWRSIYTWARSEGWDIILDVNPNFYSAFKLPNTEIEFFQNMGATGIRLDEDFQGKVESILSSNKDNFKIELNASATTKTIDATLERGGNPSNLIACHNFYPMRYTGVKYERFIQLSSHFQALGIKVASFITLPESQKGVGPWNVNEGMPSLESHRDLPIEEQVKNLLELRVVNDIIISQQGATEEQFKLIGDLVAKYLKVMEEEVVDFKIELEATISDVEMDIAFVNKGKVHNNRPDYNAYFIRSTYPRIDYADEEIKPNNTGHILVPGDVVIINENLGRYKGEIHIITKEIDDTKQCTRNLIGKVSKDDLYKIRIVVGEDSFKFTK